MTKKKPAPALKSRPSSVSEEALRRRRIRRENLSRLKTILWEKRKELIKRMSGEVQGLEADDNAKKDSMDRAFESEEDSVLIALLDVKSGTLEQIDAALQRFGEGRFGVCEECEKDIPIQRLQVVPYTLYCKGCQEEQEENGN